MRNRRARILVGAALLLALEPLVNCGDSSFSGGDVDAAANDGASETSSDAQIGDGALTDSQASDAPSSVDPCTGAEHWICDNFDRGGAISDFPYWDPSSITEDASLTMMPPGSPPPPSAPNALVSLAPPGNGASVNKGGATNGTGLHCELDFRIDQSAVDYQANLVVLSFNTSSPALYRLVMVAGPTGTGNDGFGDYGNFADAAAFATGAERHDFARGTWNHLSIEAAFGAGQPKISLNGSSVGYASSVDLATFSGLVSVSVQIGTAAYSGNGSWAVAYDNAYCDLIP